MVAIKKLELLGFKTFARKTSITFDKGLNVIMGPNGSGKSNVVDAIQFVLGELSVRSLRATNLASLVYSGNDEVPKAKFASITIHFDNSTRKIPIDTDIVTVSRYLGSDGISIYRLNGRKISRGNIIDALGVASLISGSNVINQGTTIRIADYSPEDRRKSIENVIGIAEYDRKKQEAQIQLRDAEVNLKVAVGKFEEVKKRLVELEKERNDLLRFNYVEKELKRLKATDFSEKIRALQIEIEKLTAELEARSSSLEEYKAKREELEAERIAKEKEWQEYAVKVVDRGGDQMVSLQKQIGDLNSEISGFKVIISSSKTSLRSYEDMYAAKVENLKSIRDKLISTRRELRKAENFGEEILAPLKEKRRIREDILRKIKEIRVFAEENSEKLVGMEEEIIELDKEYGKLEVRIKGEKESSEILEEQVITLQARRESFAGMHNNFTDRLKQAEALKVKEQKNFEETINSIEKVKRQIERAEVEIRGAEKIARQARLSVTEFSSRKNLADQAFSEEKALEHIANLARLKLISGVYGKLGSKVNVAQEHNKAVEAASEGWMQALVVENMDAVSSCAETLKRAKIGRVKLLPLSNLQNVKSVESPNLPGILGSAASFVECTSRYRPAVNFVLGDTLIASNEESALSVSKLGYRVVTLEGEVFQPGLKLEVGYYREPIDLSDIIPSDNSIQRINETVNSFESLLDSRKNDLKRLNEELLRLEAERVLHGDAVKYFEREILEINLNLERTHKGVVEIDRKLRSSSNRMEKLQASTAEAQTSQNEIEKRLHELRMDAANMRRKLKEETITRLESENAQLEAEINEFQRQLNEINSKIETSESNIQNVYLPQLNSIRKELIGVKGNIRNRKRDMELANEKQSEAGSKLKALESEKEKLSEQLMSKREETQKFTAAIEEISREIKKIAAEMEPMSSLVSNLREELLRCQLKVENYFKELNMLGYNQLMAGSEEEKAMLNFLLENFQEEFNSLSKIVNMNAATLYEPARRAYKELSGKINQYEESRNEIIRFMEKIENEKRETFFSALERLNAKFSETFNAITGGKGWLQLQNTDEPFSGGLDIIIEFPGKPIMPVTAASGGEKSVVAVCYIFAIQSLTKSSPFYIFDEIDAHLDPVNVQRLAELLAKEALASQLIVISFKEQVASKANRIFGIYAKNGVSNICSLPMAGLPA